MDGYLKTSLDTVKNSVLKKGWDYVCVIAGIPGVGKSTLAQQICSYLDDSFNVDRICFSAEEYRNKTNLGMKGQAFMLDESFADMNSNLYKDPEFMRTINHMQLIRQRGEFHILVLPDFFTLQKNIAIFRTSHLFVVYAEQYERGRFAIFDREAKRELYVKGKQFINYQASEPNFRGSFTKKWLVDFKIYEQRKSDHLSDSTKSVKKRNEFIQERNKLISFMYKNLNIPLDKLGEVTGLGTRQIYNIIQPTTS